MKRVGLRGYLFDIDTSVARVSESEAEMDYPLAMARAFRGEPWRCLVVETTSRALFLTAPEHAAAVQAGDCEPVAFPELCSCLTKGKMIKRGG